jgi:DNA-binding NarL/FixJ family response regulator
MTPIRVLVADKHPLVRIGLSRLLQDAKDIEIAGECDNGETALEMAGRLRPDVALLDLRLPPDSGIAVMQQLKIRKLGVQPILVAEEISDEDVLDSLRAGVRGIIVKNLASHLFPEAIRKVAAGGTWIDRDRMIRVMGALLHREEKRKAAERLLTPRELEITEMVSKGLTNRDIAERLFISEGTVKSHLYTVFEKLKIRTRTQLASWAWDNALP